MLWPAALPGPLLPTGEERESKFASWRVVVARCARAFTRPKQLFTAENRHFAPSLFPVGAFFANLAANNVLRMRPTSFSSHPPRFLLGSFLVLIGVIGFKPDLLGQG